MTTLTPEQFLATAPDPDEDVDYVEEIPVDPLQSIAESLHAIAANFTFDVPAPVETAFTDADEVAAWKVTADKLKSELEHTLGMLEAKQAQIEQVRAVVKKSVSKLANEVRAVIDPAGQEANETVTQAPGAEADQSDTGPHIEEHPAHDADVEEWRAYARSCQGAEPGTFIDNMNRSQIRTMLGIAQPTEG